MGWSDAALANRVDLGSTGVYMIGFVHRTILEQGPSEFDETEKSVPLVTSCRSSGLGWRRARTYVFETSMAGDAWQSHSPAEFARLTRAALVVDAKALFDAAKNGSLQTSAFSMKDKYSALEFWP